MSGIDGFGTILARESDSVPGTYIAIANLTSITLPSVSREVLDVTAHDSPDGWMQFIGGLKDPGEISTEANYDPALHNALVDDLDVQGINYRITTPDGSTCTFPAILTGFEPTAPHDDKLSASLTWKVTGKPTYVEES